MTDCRTCGALDCINVDDYDVYSLQQPSVIAAAQSGRIAISDIDEEPCVGDSVSFNVTATGDSVDGYTSWSVLGGSLPTGLTITSHGSYATISGIPTTAGSYTFSLLVETSNLDRGAKVFSISVGSCIDPIHATLGPGDTSWCYGEEYYANRYEIFLESGQTVNGELTTSAFGAWIDIYSHFDEGNPCDPIVASGNNDCPGVGVSAVEFTAIITGTYYIEVSSCYEFETGDYVLTIEVT